MIIITDSIQNNYVIIVSNFHYITSNITVIPNSFKLYCECKPVKINTFCISFLIERIKYLTMTDAKKVWMPDTFFRNEKEGRFHNILVPNVYIRIFPNGDVLYSIRLVLSLFLLYLQSIYSY